MIAKEIKYLQEEMEAVIKTLTLMSDNIAGLMDIIEQQTKKIKRLENENTL